MDDLWSKTVAPFLNSGIAGAILLVILWKFLPALEDFKKQVLAAVAKLGEDVRLQHEKTREQMVDVEHAVDRATKADLLRLVASSHVSDQVKEGAAVLIKEVDSAISTSKAPSLTSGAEKQV